jgi:hypothetical protein
MTKASFERLKRIARYRDKFGAAYLDIGIGTFNEGRWCVGMWAADDADENYANTITGVWFIGNSFAKKAERMKAKKDRYYGGYQGNFLPRIDTLYPAPERGRALHLFAGNVDLSAFPGDTLDLNPEVHPTYLTDAESCEGVPLGDYGFVLADPYYSDEDANSVGRCMVNRNKVIETLSRGLPIGARIAWLDQVRPMYSSKVLECEAVIGIVGSTNHRFRVLSVFRKIGQPKPKAKVTTRQASGARAADDAAVLQAIRMGA